MLSFFSNWPMQRDKPSVLLREKIHKKLTCLEKVAKNCKVIDVKILIE